MYQPMTNPPASKERYTEQDHFSKILTAVNSCKRWIRIYCLLSLLAVCFVCSAFAGIGRILDLFTDNAIKLNCRTFCCPLYIVSCRKAWTLFWISINPKVIPLQKNLHVFQQIAYWILPPAYYWRHWTKAWPFFKWFLYIIIVGIRRRTKIATMIIFIFNSS